MNNLSVYLGVTRRGLNQGGCCHVFSTRGRGVWGCVCVCGGAVREEMDRCSGRAAQQSCHRVLSQEPGGVSASHHFYLTRRRK